jgi:alkaline phosphatase
MILPTYQQYAAAQTTEWDPSSRLLTDPMLQLPTEDSVQVVWYTEFEGQEHTLTYTPEGSTPITVAADSATMTRMAEDASSTLRDGRTFEDVTLRDIWRHEATATGLTQNVRVPYFVTSINDAGETITSDEYTLQPLPTEGHGIKVLLTSDQQNRQMSPANFQKVVETVGNVDAVFVAGDFVDTPHRASEWFDRYDPAWLETPENDAGVQFPSARPAFFPSLQGYYQDIFPEFPYTGGEILQHAYLFGSIGNHESPGRWRPEERNLGQMDNDPQPRWYAELRYEQQKDEINPTGDPDIREQWIRDNSFDHIQYYEMWSHPEGPEGENYYAYQIGDVFVISMNVSRVWRTWNVNPGDRGKFTEAVEYLNNPDEWGFGDMWFQTYYEGTEQYEWLQDVLASDEFQNSRYKVVLAHQTMFGLGDNAVPVMADPVTTISYQDGSELSTLTTNWPVEQTFWEENIEPILDDIVEITHEYPIEGDVWLNDIEPLLLENGVQLVHVGHSHLWNRAQVENMHYLETSNVGNTFGAYYEDAEGIVAQRTRWASSFWNELESPDSRFDPEDYADTGDPHGRKPAFPSVFNPELEYEPLDENPRPLPYLSSNRLTAFSIFDTATSTVSSYVFDTADPESEVRLFDEFTLAVDEPAEPAQVRVAHASPDAPAVDVYVNGSTVLTEVPFFSVSDYLKLPAGEYRIQVAPAGTSPDDAVIDATVTVEGGTAYTIAATGLLTNIGATVLVDDLSDPTVGEARVTVYHFSPDAPAVDVKLANGNVLIENLAFQESASLDVPAGTYDLVVTPTGADDVVLDLSGTTLEAGVHYSVFAINTLDSITAAVTPAPGTAEFETGNVIFIHPDGTALNHWNAARMYWEGPDALLEWDQLPEMAVYRGHMTDRLTGTSNGGATVHAFGYKVLGPGSFGQDGTRPILSLSDYPGSIMREAAAAGHPVGIVNDGDLPEPGTGAFLAEVDDRGEANLIADQLLNGRPGFDDPDPVVMLGGGERFFLPEDTPMCTDEVTPDCAVHQDPVNGRGPARTDGRNLIQEAIADGWVVLRTREEFEAFKADLEADPTYAPKVLGLFAADDIFNDVPEEILKEFGLVNPNIPADDKDSNLILWGSAPGTLGFNPPTADELTEVALTILERTSETVDKSFFLVAEVESTDNLGNNSNAIGTLRGLQDADGIIGASRAFQADNPDTLIITAADSDANGMQVVAPPRTDDDGNVTDLLDNPTGASEEVNPLDGLTGRSTPPFIAEPDAYGQELPFAIAWAGSADVAGGILSRAQGLNAELLRSEFSGRFDNTDVYRMMYVTLFGELLPDAVGEMAPDRDMASFACTDPSAPGAWSTFEVGDSAPGTVIAEGDMAFMCGAGAGLGGLDDQFTYAYQEIGTDDATLVARLASLGGKGEPQAGLMLRRQIDARTVLAAITARDADTALYQVRSGSGLPIWTLDDAMWQPPVWLKLEREGNSVTGYVSMAETPGDDDWVVFHEYTLSLGEEVLAGLFVTSQDNTTQAEALFTDVTLER